MKGKQTTHRAAKDLVFFYKILFVSFEGRGKKDLGGEEREGRKEEKSFLCLRVNETNKKMRWMVYVISLLFYAFFFFLKSILCVIFCNLSYN